MKFLFDLFPILLFFIAYKFGGIYVATAVGIAASVVQIGWLLLRGKKVDVMMWLSLGIIAVFGGATLFFHNETFIKWKPTALYWLFAIGLLVSAYGFKKNVIQTMMGAQFKLPASLWAKLNLSWVLFFIVMGLVNLYVAFTYSLDTWVNFKLFGSTAMMFAFIIAQGLVLNKYIDDKEQ
ncbi:MAG: septation protein A [Sulfuriferula sp.]|jgi:intracellular septation protein|nr:septation protein A [Sulfuriferula sp.]